MKSVVGSGFILQVPRFDLSAPANPSTLPLQAAFPFPNAGAADKQTKGLAVALKSNLGTCKIKPEPTTDFMLRRPQSAHPTSLPGPNAG